MNQTESARRAIAERYLDVLAALAPPESLLEVRFWSRSEEMWRFFLPIHAQSAARIVRIGQRTDVYVGCAPRWRRSGRRGDIAPTALAWVDCDNEDAADALASFIPAPSMIVASGTGGHAHGYWALAETLAIEKVEQINRRLASAIGADTGAVTAPTAILRVPGTENFKEHPARPVQLLRCAGRRYTVAEVEAALPPLPSEESSATSDQGGCMGVGRSYCERASADPLLEIPPPRYVSVLLDRSPGRDHKVLCPFHEDRKPSLHAYETAEEGWTCFGCQGPNGKPLGGDIYKLASLLWGIQTRGASFFELRDRLDECFGVKRR